MPTAKKAATVEEIRERLQRVKAMVIAEYRGLTVQDMTELRRRARESGVEFKVYKNRLTGLAARQAEITGLDHYLEGPNSFAFGYDDPVAPAKVLSGFAREHEGLVIKGGVLDGKVVDAEGMKFLAQLPPREILLGQVLRGMQGPMSGLVNVLQGSIRNLVYALEAVRKQREEASGA
jgi:large subunit ribosomal protein L10